MEKYWHAGPQYAQNGRSHDNIWFGLHSFKMGSLRNYLPNFSNGVYYKQQRYLWACGKELGDRKQNHPTKTISRRRNIRVFVGAQKAFWVFYTVLNSFHFFWVWTLGLSLSNLDTWEYRRPYTLKKSHGRHTFLLTSSAMHRNCEVFHCHGGITCDLHIRTV
jgi:hypothetical protein